MYWSSTIVNMMLSPNLVTNFRSRKCVYRKNDNGSCMVVTDQIFLRKVLRAKYEEDYYFLRLSI